VATTLPFTRAISMIFHNSVFALIEEIRSGVKRKILFVFRAAVFASFGIGGWGKRRCIIDSTPPERFEENMRHRPDHREDHENDDKQRPERVISHIFQ